MADRTCSRCGTRFDYPCRLRQHLQRKTKCDVSRAEAAPLPRLPPFLEELQLKEAAPPDQPKLKTYDCTRCGRSFTARSNLSRHRKNLCSKSDSADTLARLEDEMRALRCAVEAGAASITAAAAAPPPAVGTQLNYTQNTQNIQNIHIHQAPVTVNYWGQEDVSWLTGPVVRALLEEALQRYGADGAAAAIWVYNEALRLTISNPERPKNLTAYIPNKKDGAPIVHRKTGWGLEPPSSCVYKPLSMRVFSQLFDNQPFDPDCDRYENIIFHLRDHEEWYHSDHSTKTLPSYLRTNKAYLAQHLGRLPQLGDPAIPAADAGEPLAAAPAGEPPKLAAQFEPLSVAEHDEE